MRVREYGSTRVAWHPVDKTNRRNLYEDSIQVSLVFLVSGVRGYV